jgi:hypothetical protein
MSRSLLAALVAALVAIVPAAARAQDGPTLTFDKPCYAEGDPMAYSGAGFTPGGEVNFLFSSLSTSRLGSFDTHADAGGAIAGTIDAPDETMFLDDDERSAMMAAAATDKTRADQGAPPDQQFAAALLRLTRWSVDVSRPNGGPPRARKPMRVDAYGFTRAIGKTLYVQYRKHGKVLKAVKLGRLAGECGDRKKTLRRGLPRGLRPGRYTLMFTTSPRRGDGERITLTQRFR